MEEAEAEAGVDAVPIGGQSGARGGGGGGHVGIAAPSVLRCVQTALQRPITLGMGHMEGGGGETRLFNYVISTPCAHLLLKEISLKW